MDCIDFPELEEDIDSSRLLRISSRQQAFLSSSMFQLPPATKGDADAAAQDPSKEHEEHITEEHEGDASGEQQAPEHASDSQADNTETDGEPTGDEARSEETSTKIDEQSDEVEASAEVVSVNQPKDPEEFERHETESTEGDGEQSMEEGIEEPEAVVAESTDGDVTKDDVVDAAEHQEMASTEGDTTEEGADRDEAAERHQTESTEGESAIAPEEEQNESVSVEPAQAESQSPEDGTADGPQSVDTSQADETDPKSDPESPAEEEATEIVAPAAENTDEIQTEPAEEARAQDPTTSEGSAPVTESNKVADDIQEAEAESSATRSKVENLKKFFEGGSAEQEEANTKNPVAENKGEEEAAAAVEEEEETEESEELDVVPPRSKSEHFRKVAKLAVNFWSVCVEADVAGYPMNSRTFCGKVKDSVVVFGLGDEDSMRAVAQLVGLLKTDVRVLVVTTTKGAEDIDMWMAEFPLAKLYHPPHFDAERVASLNLPRLHGIPPGGIMSISRLFGVHVLDGYLTDAMGSLFEAPQNPVEASEVFILHKPTGLLIGGDTVNPYYSGDNEHPKFKSNTLELNTTTYQVGDEDQVKQDWKKILSLPFSTYVGYRDPPRSFCGDKTLSGKRLLRRAVKQAGLYSHNKE